MTDATTATRDAVAQAPPREATTSGAPRAQPPSDRVLIERHTRGDAKAFEELMTIYAPRIYGFLVRAGVPARDRDDLFQEIFASVHRAAGKAPPLGEVKPWLFAIAVNAFRSHLRAAGVRAVVRGVPGAIETSPNPCERADEIAVARETASFIEGELERLPPEQREVVLLCAVEGLDQSEVARILEVPVATVKTWLRRARLALAEATARRDSRERSSGNVRALRKEAAR